MLDNPLDIIVTCSFGLEAVVKRELKDLGFASTGGCDGRIEVSASIADLPTLNMHLRAADRVLIKMGEFKAVDFDQLFDGVKELPWEDWIEVDGEIHIDGKSVRSKLQSVRTCQSMVKKAILQRLSHQLNVKMFPETGAKFTIHCTIVKDQVLLAIDTSGDGLHKRGYRQEVGEAPLRENLAAALVLLSFWNKDRVFLDPMCGSGTIAIEAALMGRNIAPGLNRSFISEEWKAIPDSIWNDARDRARKLIYPSGSLTIQASDQDAKRIANAKSNAKRAGVQEDITFEVQDIHQCVIHDEHTIIISNPPYGMKIGTMEEIDAIYEWLSNQFHDLPGLSVYLITSDKEFPYMFRKEKPDRVRKLYNGNTEVGYYQYYGKRPK